MDLYKFKNYTYTTNDLFFDKPCEVMGVPLYPIKVKDYDLAAFEKEKYSGTFTLSTGAIATSFGGSTCGT